MYNFNLHIPTRIHFFKGTISYLSELKNMSGDEIKELQNDIEYIQSERNKELLDALESSEENSKKVKLCKKNITVII